MLRKNEKTNIHLSLGSHYCLSNAVSVVHVTFSELRGLEFYWHSGPSTYKDSLENFNVFSGKSGTSADILKRVDRRLLLKPHL